MFGKSLSITDMSELVEGFKAEKYILAAEKLATSLKPIVKDLKLMDNDEYILSKERKEQFGTAVKTITAIQNKIGNTISPPLRTQLTETCEILSLFKRNDRNFILYADKDEDNQPTLMASNPNYATRMKDVLWSRDIPMTLTSGTLAVGDDFSRFIEQVGLKRMKKRITESVTPSPFDYKQNCLMYLPKYMRYTPDRSMEYARELADIVIKLILATHGHTLVLFNAYSVMAAVYERVKKAKLKFPMFILGKNQSRALEEFRASGNGVLFATGAVWEGFDFPGDIVSSLIITRLPFAIPNALSDYEKKNHPSLKVFLNKVIVPDVQIKLRQGSGRSIRTETDTCAISVLDERSLVGRRYHAAVLAALPKMRITNYIGDVAVFIREKKGTQYWGCKEATLWQHEKA